MAKFISPDSIIYTLESQVILPNSVLSPTLGVIIKKDESADGKSYLSSIRAKAKKYNAQVDVHEVTDAVEALAAIDRLKVNPGCYGIIILSHFSGADVALGNSIPVRLDIDCVGSRTMGEFVTNQSNIAYRLAPCAAVACWKILEYRHGENLNGMRVAVLGRSLRVGKPLANILCQHNATVTLFHSKSPKNKFLEEYDVVVSAMGIPKEVSLNNFSYYSCEKDIGQQEILDVGINLDSNGKLCGDVDVESFEHFNNFYITPVPGGIGKLATVILFTKLFTNATEMRGVKA